MRYLPFILLFALIVYALVDCVRYDDSEMPAGMPKALWVVLIVVFPAAGAIAWLVVSRVHAHASTGRGARPGTGRPPMPPRHRPVTRQVAPDDDPEFLASLGRRAGGDPTPPAPDEEPSAADETGPAGGEQGPADGRPGPAGDQGSDDGEGSGPADRPGAPPAA